MCVCRILDFITTFFFFAGRVLGAAYLHETLQLPWLRDKRPDYSTWHPLGWCCLNIVQSKSDTELLSFFLSGSPLLLSLFFFRSFVLTQRGICEPAQSRGLKTKVLKVNTPLWLTSCESSRAPQTLSFKACAPLFKKKLSHEPFC